MSPTQAGSPMAASPQGGSSPPVQLGKTCFPELYEPPTPGFAPSAPKQGKVPFGGAKQTPPGQNVVRKAPPFAKKASGPLAKDVRSKNPNFKHPSLPHFSTRISGILFRTWPCRIFQTDIMKLRILLLTTIASLIR